MDDDKIEAQLDHGKEMANLLHSSESFRFKILRHGTLGLARESWYMRKVCSQCSRYPRTPYCKLKVCKVKLTVDMIDKLLTVEQKHALKSQAKYIDCFNCGRSGR